MKQYLDLVDTVLNEGLKKENRTGTDTLMYFGCSFYFLFSFPLF